MLGETAARSKVAMLDRNVRLPAMLGTRKSTVRPLPQSATHAAHPVTDAIELAALRERAVQHQRLDPLRMGGGEQDRGRPALRFTEQRGLLHAGGIHHCPDVLGTLLD